MSVDDAFDHRALRDRPRSFITSPLLPPPSLRPPPPRHQEKKHSRPRTLTTTPFLECRTAIKPPCLPSTQQPGTPDTCVCGPTSAPVRLVFFGEAARLGSCLVPAHPRSPLVVSLESPRRLGAPLAPCSVSKPLRPRRLRLGPSPVVERRTSSPPRPLAWVFVYAAVDVSSRPVRAVPSSPPRRGGK
mmetsp:Transcript_2371/g.6108  ORF Transcript_2371/g.6108 Transcript_2371/m.6108 type:complete len:187 (-) Transcript_2371:97-657(-)